MRPMTTKKWLLIGAGILLFIFICVGGITFVNRNNAATDATQAALQTLPSATLPVAPAATGAPATAIPPTAIIPPPATEIVPTAIAPTASAATPTASIAAPAGVVNPMDHFVGEVPSCTAVNADWLKEFGVDKDGEKIYQVDPKNATVFVQGDFIMFEGVTLLNPDVHTERQISGEPFLVYQGNAWDCGIVSDLDVQHTMLFKQTGQKMINEESIGNLKTYYTFSPLRTEPWIFESGVTSETATIWPEAVLPRKAVQGAGCPVTVQEQAFGVRGEGIHTVAATNAGCNILVIDGKNVATLYKGTNPMLEQLTIGTYDKVYVVNPALSAAQVASALNIGAVIDATGDSAIPDTRATPVASAATSATPAPAAAVTSTPACLQPDGDFWRWENDYWLYLDTEHEGLTATFTVPGHIAYAYRENFTNGNKGDVQSGHRVANANIVRAYCK